MSTATVEAPVSIADLLWSRPDHRDGRPCIVGSSISVQHIGVLHKQGLSTEEIWHELFESVSLAHIHAALAHYLANKAAIDADLEAQDEEYDRLAEMHRMTRPSDR